MMPKPKAVNRNLQNNKQRQNHSSEKILYDSQPNMILYSDNFILKIVVLFFLIFMFNPILALVFQFQGRLRGFYNIDISNLTFISELIVIFCILIVVIKLILDVLDWQNTTYTLTDKRIIIKRGLLNKETITMPYSKVQDIDIAKSFLDRIMGVGDIVIYGGHDNSETILDAAPSPDEIEQIILDRIDNYQSSINQYPQGYIQPDQSGYYPPNQNGYIQPNPAGNYPPNQQDNYQQDYTHNNNRQDNNRQGYYKQNSYRQDNNNSRNSYTNSNRQEDYTKNNNNDRKDNNTLDKYFSDEYKQYQNNSKNNKKANKSNAHYFEARNDDNPIRDMDYNRVSEIEYNNNKLDKDELISINRKKFKK